MYRIKKANFCKETSKKFCVKDEFGFTMPHLIKSDYVIPNESRSSTFKINIQPSKYELITDVKIYVQEFSKSWLNIVLEKVATDTEIQLNQIAQILSTANHDVFNNNNNNNNNLFTIRLYKFFILYDYYM